jgi:hypothetical protein
VVQLIPGHGWADVAGVVAVVLAAFALYLFGLVAVAGRVDR